MSKALNTQVGGNHYKNLAIQPVEYIFKNNIGYFEGCVIKYVTRWKNKGGVQDLEKAKHFLELLIDLQEQYAKEGMLDLVQQELAECCKVEVAEELPEYPKYDEPHYRYLILADSVMYPHYYVGTFEERDVSTYYPQAVKFYSYEEAEKFIATHKDTLHKYPYGIKGYYYGENKRQLYVSHCKLANGE